MKPSFLLPRYPKELEDWWWKKALQKWPEHSEEKTLNLIRKEVVLQSDRFNKTRSFDPNSYGSRDLSVLAYGNFFFPRTWNAMTYCTAEAIFRGWKKHGSGPIRILDIGSGTGASGLSVLYMIKKLGIHNPVFMESWDYSGKSLTFLKNIHKELNYLWTDSKLHTQRTDLRYLPALRSKQKFDLILLGYSLNEIIESKQITETTNWLEGVTNLLSPNGYLIITEPAEKETCNNLQNIASLISKGSKNCFIHAPYFNGLDCPLKDKETHYYSHEVRKNHFSNIQEKINRPLNLEINLVKFGMLILSKLKPNNIPMDARTCRIVSPINKKKGTVGFIGIASDGSEYRYEIQRRSLKPDQTKILTKLERGDVLNFSELETVKEEHKKRIPTYESISWPFSPRWSD